MLCLGTKTQPSVNFMARDTVGNPCGLWKWDKGGGITGLSNEAWDMHAHTHTIHMHTSRVGGYPSPVSIHLTHTQAYTLFLHSSPVWHTSSKPTNTSKTAHHRHHPSRWQRLLKTCTAPSHTKTNTALKSMRENRCRCGQIETLGLVWHVSRPYRPPWAYGLKIKFVKVAKAPGCFQRIAERMTQSTENESTAILIIDFSSTSWFHPLTARIFPLFFVSWDHKWNGL